MLHMLACHFSCWKVYDQSLATILCWQQKILKEKVRRPFIICTLQMVQKNTPVSNKWNTQNPSGNEVASCRLLMQRKRKHFHIALISQDNYVQYLLCKWETKKELNFTKRPKPSAYSTTQHIFNLFLFAMNIDEFPSLDFLLPYTGNTLQTKLLLGAFAGLVFGIMLILLSSLLIIRWRRGRRKRLSGVVGLAGPDGLTMSALSSSGCGALGGGDQTLNAGTTEQSFGGNVGYNESALRGGGHDGSVDSLDKNPDIIPSQGT